MKRRLMLLPLFFTIMSAHPAHGVTLIARTKVSCQSLLENFPHGRLADSENIELIIDHPNENLNSTFNFQDAVTLINDLLKKNNQAEAFRTETLESVYNRSITIINVRRPFAKGLVRSTIFWNNERPETTERLVERLLDAVTIIYQTKIPKLGQIKILRKSPNGFLHETEAQVIEMLRLQNTILEILNRSETFQRRLILSKTRQAVSTPLSLLIDRQRAQLRFVRRTPELAGALASGDLEKIGKMVALRFGPQTYVRWFWQVVNDALIVTTVATAVSVGPSFVRSVSKMLKLTDQVYGVHDKASIRRAENFVASSDDVRLEVLRETLDQTSVQNLSPDEKEYVRSLSRIIDQHPAEK